MLRINFVILLALIFSVKSIGQSLDSPQNQVEDSLLQVARIQSNLYRKSNVSIEFQDSEGKPITGLRVTARHTRHNFRFGSPIDLRILGDEITGDPASEGMFLENLFNYVVFNSFYWDKWEPQRGQTDKSTYGSSREWINEKRLPVKGHTLAWPSRQHLPKWVFDLPADEVEELLMKRIEDITREFKGVVDVWDVVNEPLHQGPWEAVLDMNLENPQMPCDLGVVQELADYVEKCHRAAYRGNPEGVFVLNEYEVYTDQEIRTLFYLLVRELQSRNVPLHGLGLQSHLPEDGWPDPRNVWDTWNSYADLNLPIHITEFQVPLSEIPIVGNWRTGTWDEEAQSSYMELMLRLAFGHPSVDAFVWWGEADSLGTPEKPVFQMFNKLINQEWKTSVDLHTDFNGWIAFRGYNGSYDVEVWDGRKKLGDYKVQVSKDGMNTWSFILE